MKHRPAAGAGSHHSSPPTRGRGLKQPEAGQILAFVLVALIHAALAGIYSAALYRYAMGEASSTGFDGQMLQQAFRLK